MATEKQRRRRAKEKRHAYDLVEIDEEGNERVVTSSALRSSEPAKSKAKSSSAKSSSAQGGRPARGGRGTPQPPSWNRVLKRGALFSPAFFAIIYILGGKQTSVVAALINAIFLVGVFIPFSYFLDGLMWRQYVKRNPGAAKR